MFHKYCPECASLRLEKVPGSKNYKCLSCNYQGEIKEDSIDKINLYKKRVKLGVNLNPQYTTYLDKDPIKKDNISLKEKLAQKSTKSTGDWEIL